MWSVLQSLLQNIAMGQQATAVGKISELKITLSNRNTCCLSFYHPKAKLMPDVMQMILKS